MAAGSEQVLDPLNHRPASWRALDSNEEGVVTGDRAEDACELLLLERAGDGAGCPGLAGQNDEVWPRIARSTEEGLERYWSMLWGESVVGVSRLR